MELHQTENDLTKGKSPKKSKVAVAAFIIGILSIFIFLLIYVWFQDAPPPEKDYTMADLVHVPEEYYGSYDLLISLSEPTEPALGEEMEDILELMNAVLALENGQKTISELPDKIKTYFEEQGVTDFQALSEKEQKRHLENCIKNPEEEKEPIETKIGLTDVEIKKIGNFVKHFNERHIETGNYDFSSFQQEFPEAEKINNLWQKAQKGRDVFEQLWQFPQIADLTEPRYDSDVNYLDNIRDLCRLYQAYIYLCISEGQYETALNEIEKWHIYNQKFFASARPIVTRLSLLGIQSATYGTANYLVNSPAIEGSLLERILRNIMPLDNKVIGFKQSIIFDYLTAKNELDNLIQTSTKNGSGIFKRNSTLRCLLYYYRLSEYQNVWPGFCRNVLPNIQEQIDDGSFFDENGKLYKIYNPGGYTYVGITVPAYGSCFRVAKKIQVKDDLFQWVLARRMGQEGSLKARAYSDEYTVDIEKGLVFSVGPDGEPYTDDDIKLRIDPEVLGLE